MNPNFKIPTETVELPSKGLLYPKDSPLASGTIEMKDNKVIVLAD